MRSPFVCPAQSHMGIAALGASARHPFRVPTRSETDAWVVARIGERKRRDGAAETREKSADAAGAARVRDEMKAIRALRLVKSVSPPPRLSLVLSQHGIREDLRYE